MSPWRPNCVRLSRQEGSKAVGGVTALARRAQGLFVPQPVAPFLGRYYELPIHPPKTERLAAQESRSPRPEGHTTLTSCQFGRRVKRLGSHDDEAHLLAD